MDYATSVRGAWMAVSLLLAGCVHDAYDPGLPAVRPEGAAATVLTQHGQAEAARAHLGWMIAHQANGRFRGYTDAEKIVSSGLRSGGLACRNDRSTQMKITYPTGLFGMPVHVHDGACARVSEGWPRTEDFGGADRNQLVAAARAIGMACADEPHKSVCRIDVQWTWERSKGVEVEKRSARVTVDATGGVVADLEGFPSQNELASADDATSGSMQFPWVGGWPLRA